MSFPQRRTSFGRGVRPAQVFKKRNLLFNTTALNNADATLIAELVLRETGTVYSLKVSINGIHISGVAGDVQRIMLWARCVPAVTGLPDLTASVELDNSSRWQ